LQITWYIFTIVLVEYVKYLIIIIVIIIDIVTMNPLSGTVIENVVDDGQRR